MPKTKSKKITALIVAAHASELRPLATLDKKHLIFKEDRAYLAAGIGPVAAAFGLTHFLEDCRPQSIIVVGTAGIINIKKFSIGDVVIGKSVSTESGLAECYTPKLQPSFVTPPQPPSYLKRGALIPPSLKIRGGLGRGYKSANIFSPQEITHSADWQKQLLKSGFDVEHLESFAFAYVAKKFRIPITIALGLTNIIDQNAHRDWIRHQEKLMKKVSVCASNMFKLTNHL